MFTFRPERVQWKQQIGKGGYGRVYPYQKNPTDNRWVVKKIVPEGIMEVFQHLEEIVLGFSCDNPYVLPVKGYFISHNEIEEDYNIYIKLPRMKHSLRQIVAEHQKNQTTIPEADIVKYFYRITRGLKYLHGRGIAHRDIKPDNILVDGNGNIKISDIGLAVLQGEDTTYTTVKNRAGTRTYIAPEIADLQNKLTKKDLYNADLWSLGILLTELCTMTSFKLSFASLTGKEKEATVAQMLETLAKEEKYSKTLVDLISGLLRAEPSERMKLEKIESKLTKEYGERVEMENNSVVMDSLGKSMSELAERDSEIEALKSQLKNLEIEFTSSDKKAHTELDKKESEIRELNSQLRKINIELISREQHVRKLEAYFRDVLTDIPLKEPNNFRVEQFEYKRDAEIMAIALNSQWKGLFKFAKNSRGEGLVIEMENYKLMKGDTVKLMMQDLIEMCQSKESKRLAGLEVYLHRWYSDGINDAIKEFISQMTTKMTYITELRLNFGSGNWNSFYPNPGVNNFLSGETVNELCAKLGDNMHALENFGLILSGSGIMDDELSALATEVLGKCKKINRLLFDFSNCPKITDVGFQSLVSKIKNLTFLGLTFDNCQITDEGINTLASIISSSPKLETLWFYFNGCNGITEASLQDLINQTLNLDNNTSIELCFRQSGCSQQGKRLLLESFNKLSKNPALTIQI